MDEKTPQNLSLARNAKIGLFHLGSGIVDVMTTGVWNRIMISDLGYAATPIGLLVSLRYFLAPLGVWAGRMSDTRRILGFRRLFWVWLGRAMMIISTFGLGLATAQLARGADNEALMWAVIVVSMLLFSLGSAFSGTTFLALIYDRAPEHQRGRAVGIVWTFLLLGYMVAGILFSRLLPSEEGGGSLTFSPDMLQTLFIVTAFILGGLWFFSVLGEERRRPQAPQETQEAPAEQEQRSVRDDMRRVWVSRPMRFFLFYLALSMFFAFSQDLVLEPFAGDVFGMPAETTNRFSAYWGSTAIVGTLFFLWLSRKVAWLTNTVMSYIGVGALLLTFVLLSVSALAQVEVLVRPVLFLLGFGLGLWNVGTLGLMVDMSPEGKAGTFLGFWTVVVTFSRGFGVSGGGIIHDVFAQATGNEQIAYGMVFVIGSAGLAVALAALSQINMRLYKAAERDTSSVFAAAMD